MGEQRPWLRGAGAGACILLLSACGAASASTTPSTPMVTGAVSPAAAATLLATAAPSAAPELSSTTVVSTAAPDGSVTVEMAAGQFMPRTLVARAGEVVFFLNNTSVQGIHTLAIDRAPLEYSSGKVTNTPLAVSEKVRYRQAATFTVEALPAGTYFIWCTIENHAAEGMTGTLTVSP